ncbi:MAG TPA: class I fructose-bisphosphate aldolase [Caulobacteraceae bacterium]|jgi:fructose-bisphosphate aldolase class I|nr:class I fructose-bisphosphate aldolase [Caulobacteraceae bacterium]
MTHDLPDIAAALVARGKGILAADETPATLTRRFDAHGIPSTEENRRAYREMLFSAKGAAEFIGGVILQDETIHQKSSTGRPLIQLVTDQGILAGIKVDAGAKPLAGSSGETVTEGLDGLRERLTDYHAMGARFAKWRAVIRIGEAIPSRMCILANAHALARYAALSQEQGLVPIVEPEVLMDGDHTIERCEEVTSQTLLAVFDALEEQAVTLEGMLLKPNMVVAGDDCARQPDVDEVAFATLRCLRRRVPAAVPGIVFLSGGQTSRLATAHLNAINRLPGPKPWAISFSFGRALQDDALTAWRGREEGVAAGRQAFVQRARFNCAAALGKYTDESEDTLFTARASAPRRELHDD